MVNIITRKPQVHLIIPDSHSHPDYKNDRYEWLGKLIVDLKPDVVIDIGDWFDLASLNPYDKGAKKAYQALSYRKDINAGLDAQEKMFAPIKKAKRKKPRFVRCLGNHEARITKALETDPILIGTISLTDLQSKEYGWEEYPFLEHVEIDGVTYSHYFISGIMGRAIGGEHHAASLVTKQLKSCTQGHSHLFDYSIRTSVDGTRIHGCVVGVYQDYWADWAGPSNRLWNPGVVVKREVENGSYDIEWISLARIKKEYGS